MPAAHGEPRIERMSIGQLKTPGDHAGRCRINAVGPEANPPLDDFSSVRGTLPRCPLTARSMRREDTQPPGLPGILREVLAEPREAERVVQARVATQQEISAQTAPPSRSPRKHPRLRRGRLIGERHRPEPIRRSHTAKCAADTYEESRMAARRSMPRMALYLNPKRQCAAWPSSFGCWSIAKAARRATSRGKPAASARACSPYRSTYGIPSASTA